MTINKRYKKLTIAFAISLLAIMLSSVFKIFSPFSEFVKTLMILSMIATIGFGVALFLRVISHPDRQTN